MRPPPAQGRSPTRTSPPGPFDEGAVSLTTCAFNVEARRRRQGRTVARGFRATYCYLVEKSVFLPVFSPDYRLQEPRSQSVFEPTSRCRQRSAFIWRDASGTRNAHESFQCPGLWIFCLVRRNRGVTSTGRDSTLDKECGRATCYRDRHHASVVRRPGFSRRPAHPRALPE